MENEQKYSVVGKVEIGTDEYRDLITNSIEQSNRADKTRSEIVRKFPEFDENKIYIMSVAFNPYPNRVIEVLDIA